MRQTPRHWPPNFSNRLSWLFWLPSFFWFFVPFPLGAQEFEVHGFLSQGYLKSTGNNYLAKTKAGTWEYSEAAVNFATNVNDEISIGLQLFTRELGTLGNFSVELDWAFGDYAFRDWLNFRIGRIKNPYGLYGETQDADIVRATVLLPQSVYFLALRDLLISFNGIAAYGTFDLWPLGSFDYQLYGGSIMFPNSDDSSIAYYFESEAYDPQTGVQAFELDRVKAKWLAGGALKWHTYLDGLVLNASAILLTGKGVGTISPEVERTQNLLGKTPDGWTNELIITFHETLFWVASIQYTHDNFIATSEYARYSGTFEMSKAPLIPHSILDQDRWYIQLEFRLNSFIQTASYYSYLLDNNDQRKVQSGELDAHSAFMKDWAFSIRFDLTESWLLKLESHFIDGTAQVYAIENKSSPNLQRFWTLFAAKTTVTF